MDFSSLELHADLKRGLSEAGYKSAMPVQEQVLNCAFTGRDLYVQSQTGTGKTAAYLIVIMQRLLSEPLLKGKKALIMVPTRELAVQVETEAKLIGKYLDFKIGSFYGGVGYSNQQKMLRDNVQILMGTPGRVLDLNGSGQMNLMDIGFLILDEADRMFDMGFYPDLRKLIKLVPAADRRQTMLFSATLNNYVKNLAWEYTKEPLEIEIAPESVTVEEINQVLYHVPSTDKFKLLLGIFKQENPESAIIFCNTKRYTETVAKRLRVNGIKCEFISGDLPQSRRLSIIGDFKAGKVRFLVATDVAARGLDIEALSLVINYDLPAETENYVHRIGRTARAGMSGKAVSFASEHDVYELSGIEKYIGKKIPALVATEELYGEDVSKEAMRSSEPRRKVQARQRQEEPRENKKPAGKTRRPAQRPRSGGGRSGDSHSEDLSKMSFEERMSYYKSKYSAEPAGENVQGQGKKAAHEGKKAAPSKNRRGGSAIDLRAPAPAGYEAGGSSVNKGKNFNKKKRRKNSGAPPTNTQAKNPQNVKENHQEESKGLLKGIFKILGKKKQD